MSRICTVCSNPDHHAIDLAICSLASGRRIARAYGVSRQAVQRHRWFCIPAMFRRIRESPPPITPDARRRGALAKATKRKAVVDRALEMMRSGEWCGAESVLERLGADDEHEAAPMRKDDRPPCGARCRSKGGAPCVARVYRRPDGSLAARCRLHGGASTGARTAEGLERLREAGRRGAAERWRQWKAGAPGTAP